MTSAQAARPKPQTPAHRATGAPSYEDIIRTELEALKLSPTCEQTGRTFECKYLGRSSMTQRRFDVRATYRPQPRTVDVQIRNFLIAPASSPATAPLLKRLMALNWKLLAARFSWNPDTGEVRLGTTLHTDSNFDRRAFRSLVRAIDELGPHYHPELTTLQRSLQPRPVGPTDASVKPKR